VKPGAIGETCVDKWCGIIESTTRTRCQSLRESSDFILTGEPDVTSDQTCAFVYPD
jgi:hypothetical protein